MARILKKIPQRNEFHILTNGKRTEYNYFNLIKKKKSSIYDVKVKFFNDDPYKLVEHAESYLSNANQVWCVFDIDNTFEDGSLIAALKLAKEKGINVAFSNKSFEVWLLSHYKKCISPMDNNKLISQMNDIIKNTLHLDKDYLKSDETLLDKYFIPKYKTAIINSKIVHQKFIKEFEEKYPNNKNYRIWEWNPCTNVYEMLEAMQLKG